jgi:exodeoxyribonuclease VII large subunit
VAARFPGYPVRFREVNVSGAGAAEAIVGGLRTLLADPDVEVVILARGGGDASQLLPFSDEELCRAVGAAKVPVVTAIGHEGDRPLCDEVADLRCATPSLAANAVVPSRRELEERLRDRLAGADPSRRVAESLRLLERIDRHSALAHRMARARGQLADRRHTLDALDPTRVLARGYAVVRDAQGTVVRDAAAVSSGEALDVQLARGRLAVEVTSAGR